MTVGIKFLVVGAVFRAYTVRWQDGRREAIPLPEVLTYLSPGLAAVPYVSVSGPMGSGKSRILELLQQVVFRPLLTSSTSEAAISGVCMPLGTPPCSMRRSGFVTRRCRVCLPTCSQATSGAAVPLDVSRPATGRLPCDTSRSSGARLSRQSTKYRRPSRAAASRCRLGIESIDKLAELLGLHIVAKPESRRPKGRS